jgi:hypothetical protein
VIDRSRSTPFDLEVSVSDQHVAEINSRPW